MILNQTMFADLYLNPATCPESKDNKRQYYDFIISGQPLRKYLGIKGDSSVTLFGWFDKLSQAEALKEFRCQVKPALPDNRISLYVCAACGELGCGSITAQIIDKGDKIIWTKFADQSDPDEVSEIYNVEDLEFERNSYFKAFSVIR